MKLFDYIFYRAYNLFLKIPYRSYAENIQAICALSALQFFNLFFLELLFSYIFKESLLSLDIYLILGIMIILLFLNYLRYGGTAKLKEFEKRWKNESKKQNLIRGGLVLIYVILSIVLAVGAAHYVGKYFREH